MRYSLGPPPACSAALLPCTPTSQCSPRAAFHSTAATLSRRTRWVSLQACTMLHSSFAAHVWLLLLTMLLLLVRPGGTDAHRQ
jgi:hypothetical protein